MHLRYTPPEQDTIHNLCRRYHTYWNIQTAKANIPTQHPRLDGVEQQSAEYNTRLNLQINNIIYDMHIHPNIYIILGLTLDFNSLTPNTLTPQQPKYPKLYQCPKSFLQSRNTMRHCSQYTKLQ